VTHLLDISETPPAEGLRLYAEQLRSGFSADDIRSMMQTNPELLLKADEKEPV
jgi:hypothetical protein